MRRLTHYHTTPTGLHTKCGGSPHLQITRKALDLPYFVRVNVIIEFEIKRNCLLRCEFPE
jgi:hypothetical protein